MNAVQKRAREIRAAHAKYGQHTPMRRALSYARQEVEHPSEVPELEWRDGCIHPCMSLATFEHGPFIVTVRIEYDESPDLSWIGEFTQYENRDSIDLKKADHGHYWRGPHDYRYFTPATEYRNLDWRLMKKILDDDMIPVGLRVVVSKEGIDLGEASIWGCFWEYGKEDEVAPDYLPDLLCEAVEEAESMLQALCPMA